MQAVEMRYPKAFLNLGKCYEHGLGVKLNIEKARAYFTEGAELDDSQCKL
jgi:TPR repeat protein